MKKKETELARKEIRLIIDKDYLRVRTEEIEMRENEVRKGEERRRKRVEEEEEEKSRKRARDDFEYYK